MNITQELKIEIYHALTDFLEAYKTENTQVLAEKTKALCVFFLWKKWTKKKVEE